MRHLSTKNHAETEDYKKCKEDHSDDGRNAAEVPPVQSTHKRCENIGEKDGDSEWDEDGGSGNRGSQPNQ
jgi:hypothetical protein